MRETNADARHIPLPPGTVLLLGVMGEHDSESAEETLDLLTAWMAANPSMPLVFSHLASDCLVSPPERGKRHFEVRWIEI